VAFEADAGRCRLIAENADRLGTPRLTIVQGEAPASLTGNAAPDAVFIGGGLGDPGLFEVAWDALKPGGAIAANVISIEGELHLYDLHEKHGGDISRIEVSHLSRIGSLRALKPRMAVTHWWTRKPW
jgi:precorrin-6Y C5,15-methyltransferase (decarboxylating)